ncbi:Ima1 N-terminal domain-containing protein [Chaetomium fimeti]|uniref:Ima1 N-terminal domain-containing protein n=1 Tax=Chaetomium fimeti TaxID=1854472 RepID=A0AAE0HJS7_9PEZI|nr:Ima1 N-terminal domain-containing protein [Chaetomium fimeti]
MSRLYRSRNRYLSCFYCGRKNSTRYDGKTRRFECPFCDATNYLDENGDITDPPVATEKEATPLQYAVPRPFSPTSSPTREAIFCPKCLKNQHLLSASLAQYLPDPDDPDYAEREKGLYRFRKNQERLYPQICEECEPRVRRRLEQSAYTAKTDLLRRMLDRSASARGSVTTQGWLEKFDAAGRWLWISGLLLQLVWHAVVVHSLLLQYFVWAGVDDSLSTFRLLKTCGPLVGSLPSAGRLLGWSILTTILSMWWNPRFVQIYRGFTRHISGVSQWYIFQAMAVILRICLQRIDLTTPNPPLLNTQTAGHAVAASLAFLLFTLGPRAIRINMAPLFGASPNQPLHDHPESSPSPQNTRLEETKSIADLLDEISRSPTSPTPPSPTLDLSPSIPKRHANFLPMGHAHTQAAQTLTANLQQIDDLHLHRPHTASRDPFAAPSTPRPRVPPSTAEEMDWSPTPTTPFAPPSALTPAAPPSALTPFTPADPSSSTSASSRHRAFNTRGQRSSQGFGQAPVEPRAGPFWYRVPPAPTTPAQRVFNPPNQPRLRASPVDSLPPRSPEWGGMSPFAGGRGGSNGGGGGGGMENGVGERMEELGGGRGQVAFAEPSFFAEDVVGRAVAVNGQDEDRRNDPRNELSGLFGEGFKLSEEEVRRREGWWKRLIGNGEDGKSGQKRD